MRLITLGDPLLLPPDPLAHDELDDLRDASPRAVYRWALTRGWTVEQAGNLAAWFAGLPVVDGEDSPTSAWTLRSVEHLRFVRYLLETCRIGSADDGGTTPWWYRVGARRPTPPSPAGSSPTTGPRA